MSASSTRTSSSTRKSRRAENALRILAYEGVSSGFGAEFGSLKSLSRSTRREPIFSVAATRKHYGKKKMTWLMKVSGEGDKDNLREVLGRGAPRDAVDSTGRSALYYAIENNRPENVELLIEKKASVNVRDEDGWTPLILATHENRPRIVEILLKAGAKTEDKSEDGLTALHVACKWDYPEIVELLLEAGANRNLRSDSHKTAFEMAKSDRVREIFQKVKRGGRRSVKRSKNTRRKR